MRLTRYGIVLDELKPDHLEMVRLWRNQEFVRNNMEFTQLISREAQETWFNGLDTEANLYWVIRTHDYPIGLIHIKNINHQAGSGEAGIFVGEPSYLEMPQPMLAILFMMELAFAALGLEQLKAKIKSGNHKAIDFNARLGYSLIPGQPDGFQYYAATKEAFNISTEKLRSQMRHMYGKETRIEHSEVRTKLATRLIAGIQDAETKFNPFFA